MGRFGGVTGARLIISSEISERPGDGENSREVFEFPFTTRREGMRPFIVLLFLVGVDLPGDRLFEDRLWNPFTSDVLLSSSEHESNVNESAL